MDTLYLAAVCAVLPGLRRSTITEILKKLSSSKALFEASEEELLATGLVEPKQLTQFITKRRLDMPEKLDRFCKANSVNLVSIFDGAYPKA